jgi:hypothetical protein
VIPKFLVVPALAVVGTLVLGVGARPTSAADCGTPGAKVYPDGSHASLEDFINSLAPGDTGFVRSGTYSDTNAADPDQIVVRASGSSVGGDTQYIEVRGCPNEPMPVIRASIQFWKELTGGYVHHLIFDHLEVDGTGLSCDTPPKGVLCDTINTTRGNAHITLSDMDITNGNTLNTHGCITNGADWLTITRSVIHDCGGDTSQTNDDHCIYLGHGAFQTITHNLLVHCGVWGVHLYPGPQLSFIQHNVIDGAGGGVVFGGSDRFSDDHSCEAVTYTSVTNNAITNSTGDLSNTGRVPAAALAYWEDGCVSSTPMFNSLAGNCFYNNANVHGDVDLGAGAVVPYENPRADPMYQPGYHIPPSSRCYANTGDPVSHITIPNPYRCLPPPGAPAEPPPCPVGPTGPTGSTAPTDATGSFGAASPAGPGSPPGGIARQPSASLPLIAGSVVSVTRQGSASLALRCPGTRRCAGTLILKTAKPVRLKRKRKRIVRLGATRFSIPARRTKRVKVHLSSSRARLVQKLKRLSAIAIVERTDGALGKHRIVLKAAR